MPMFLVEAQDMVTRLANILRYSLQRERNHKVPLETELEVVSDSRVSWRESQSQVQPLLQEHVIVSLVRDCYPHAVAWS